MNETGAAGGGGAFPPTRGSALRGLTSPDAAERERSLAALAEAYWQPVCRHVRRRWGRGAEDAADLTQSFFARAVEKGWFAAYDPARGRFRTFLRSCLDAFLMNERKAARAAKRGGEAVHLPLDEALHSVESPEDAERAFEKEWVRGLFALALAGLRDACRQRGRERALALFERHDLVEPGERPGYEALAAEVGASPGEVSVDLAFARREFRRILLDRLRDITTTDEEFRLEARVLLGRDP